MPKLKSLHDALTPVPEATFGGVRPHPEACKLCPLNWLGSGFVPDEMPATGKPRIAMMFEFPAGDDIVEGRPLVSRGGQAWLRRLVYALGHRKDEVLICNTLRCRPRQGRYPTGVDQRQAELCCRAHDGTQWGGDIDVPGGLLAFDPNVFLVSYNPGDILDTPSLYRLVRRDVEKAFSLADRDYRPLMLMGKGPAFLVAPWLQGKGGIKAWRGHWWEGSWPWQPGYVPPKPTQFLVA